MGARTGRVKVALRLHDFEGNNRHRKTLVVRLGESRSVVASYQRHFEPATSSFRCSRAVGRPAERDDLAAGVVDARTAALCVRSRLVARRSDVLGLDAVRRMPLHIVKRHHSHAAC